MFIVDLCIYLFFTRNLECVHVLHSFSLICCQIYKIAHQDFRTSEITNFELVCMWVNL
jgi:hypothetical protein